MQPIATDGAGAQPLRLTTCRPFRPCSTALTVHTVRRVRTDASRGSGQRLTREASWLVGGLGSIAALMGASLWPVAAERPAALISHPLAISTAIMLFGLGAAFLTVSQRW